MNAGKWLIIALLIFVMTGGLYGLWQKKTELRLEAEALSANLAALQKERETLTAKLEYFSHPENLVKELKSKFNYREEGEKLIILISSSTASSSGQ